MMVGQGRDRQLHGLCVILSSYKRVVEGLGKDVGELPAEAASVPLHQALLRIGGREKPWAAIIGALISAQLPYSLVSEGGRLGDRVSVADGSALAAVLPSVFDRAAHPGFEFAATMRQRDAIELMNIDPSRWQETHRSLPDHMRAEQKKLRVEEALRVAGEVVDHREAKARRGVPLDRAEMIRKASVGTGPRQRLGTPARRGPRPPIQAKLPL